MSKTYTVEVEPDDTELNPSFEVINVGDCDGEVLVRFRYPMLLGVVRSLIQSGTQLRWR